MEGIDLRDIDLNLLLALDRLLHRGNVTLAARDMGITQPAMSRTLQRLRANLGDPLLVRVGRGVVPTDRARALVEPVADALRSIQRVFEPPDPFTPAVARGEFVIALGDEAQVAFADAIVRAIWAVSPGVDVRVRPLGYSSLDEGRSGVLDLAITPDLSALPASVHPPDLSDFVVKPLYVRRFVVVSSSRHPRRNIGLDDYVAARHVIIGQDGAGRAFVDDLLEARGLHRRVAATVTSFPSAGALVAATDLLATLPEEVVHASAGALVVSRPPIDLPDLTMLGVWHPRRTRDPRHRFFRELVMHAIVENARLWVHSV